jgi:hypothetical protein
MSLAADDTSSTRHRDKHTLAIEKLTVPIEFIATDEWCCSRRQFGEFTIFTDSFHRDVIDSYEDYGFTYRIGDSDFPNESLSRLPVNSPLIPFFDLSPFGSLAIADSCLGK